MHNSRYVENPRSWRRATRFPPPQHTPSTSVVVNVGGASQGSSHDLLLHSFILSFVLSFFLYFFFFFVSPHSIFLIFLSFPQFILVFQCMYVTVYELPPPPIFRPDFILVSSTVPPTPRTIILYESSRIARG